MPALDSRMDAHAKLAALRKALEAIMRLLAGRLNPHCQCRECEVYRIAADALRETRR